MSHIYFLKLCHVILTYVLSYLVILDVQDFAQLTHKHTMYYFVLALHTYKHANSAAMYEFLFTPYCWSVLFL